MAIFVTQNLCMQLLVFTLVYPFLRLLSLLPFRVIYVLSDACYIIVYKIFGYRKKVVNANLKLVFPNKNKQEITAIEKEFYCHLCDMFLEMIKTIGISQKQLQQRFTFTNIELFQNLEKKGKSTMLMFPHYASWEWSIALGQHIKSKGYGIYQPLANRYFDEMVRRLRSKFGATLIATFQTKDIVEKNKKENVLASYGILSDQSPMPHKALYWTEFMGITVPVHTGAETISKKQDLAVVFLKVKKLKRGYYQGSFKVLAENPNQYKDFEISQAFLAETEKSIQENPAYYFWTHRRWKHRNKTPENFKTLD